jgi:hypothetical protein
MLERWLDEPLEDGPYMIFHGEAYGQRDSGFQNGSGAQRDNGVASVGEGELSLEVGEGDVSVMLGRWLDEPPNDGPYMAYRGEEYPMADSGSESEAAVERN